VWAAASVTTEIKSVEPREAASGSSAAGRTVTSVVEGALVRDTVVVERTAGTPSSAPDPTGTVVFHRFANLNCTGESATQRVALRPGSPSTAVSGGVVASADMSYRSDYLGDANYPARRGDCERLAVTTAPQPAVTIVVTPETQDVAIGSTARFTVTVTNTGNTVLTNVTVTNSDVAACDRKPSQLPALASLDPGESVSYTCARTNVPSTFDNFFTVTATPPSGPKVTAMFTARVDASSLKPPPTQPPGSTTPPPFTG
jgi:hypothetical protein